MSSGWQGWLGVSQLEPPEGQLSKGPETIFVAKIFLHEVEEGAFFFEMKTHVNQVSLTLS